MILPLEKLEIWNKSARILAGTGHRPNKLGNEYNLEGPYSKFLRENILKCFEILKPRKIISGMALGLDQLLALIALENNLKVIAAIPCDNQDSKWPDKSKKLYHAILNNSLVTKKVVSPGPYHISKMQTRNIWMTDNSDALIAAWDGSDGGTANCVRYAESRNKLIYRVDPSEVSRGE